MIVKYEEDYISWICSFCACHSSSTCGNIYVCSLSLYNRLVHNADFIKIGSLEDMKMTFGMRIDSQVLLG
jgi:hypothetical protein